MGGRRPSPRAISFCEHNTRAEGGEMLGEPRETYLVLWEDCFRGFPSTSLSKTQKLSGSGRGKIRNLHCFQLHSNRRFICAIMARLDYQFGWTGKHWKLMKHTSGTLMRMFQKRLACGAANCWARPTTNVGGTIQKGGGPDGTKMGRREIQLAQTLWPSRAGHPAFWLLRGEQLSSTIPFHYDISALKPDDGEFKTLKLWAKNKCFLLLVVRLRPFVSGILSQQWKACQQLAKASISP